MAQSKPAQSLLTRTVRRGTEMMNTRNYTGFWPLCVGVFVCVCVCVCVYVCVFYPTSLKANSI